MPQKYTKQIPQKMKKVNKLILFASILTFILAGCGEKATLEKTADTEYLITISTPMGDMKAILYDETPQHKENFIKLVEEGYYNDLLFHRVMKGFMAQGGDPDSKNADSSTQLGRGGPDYLIPAEIKPGLFHKKGALAAARQNDQVNPEKKSNGSQYYIVHGKVYQPNQLAQFRIDMRQLGRYFRQILADQEYMEVRNNVMALQQEQDFDGIQALMIEMKPVIEEKFQVELDLGPFSKEQEEAYTSIGGTPQLDNEYTVFGEVISGLEIIDKICDVKTNKANRPTEDLPMKVSMEIVSKADITSDFGYSFN